MNKLIEDITQSILNKNNIQQFQIEVLVDTLKSKEIRNPMEISFKDGKKIISVEDLFLWIKNYKDSPTKCRNLEEYEQKLLAVKI